MPLTSDTPTRDGTEALARQQHGDRSLSWTLMGSRRGRWELVVLGQSRVWPTIAIPGVVVVAVVVVGCSSTTSAGPPCCSARPRSSSR
ncbi:hypothetical protein NKG94_49765 [Micromonospora sp. M12]